MANCQLRMLGQKTHTCSPSTPLQKCTDSFPDDRSFNTFNEQLSQIDRCACKLELPQMHQLVMLPALTTQTALSAPPSQPD